MRNPPERITSREGVNAAQAFFERNGCIFQEIPQQNDFGKDAYVDLGEGGAITFLCAALQVKSGRSYRTAEGDYSIPVEGHAHNWRHSTVPIVGLVYDPDDRLIRWCDITGHLRANPAQDGGTIHVRCDAVLNETSLRGEFNSAVAEYSGTFGAITANLIGGGPLQADAAFDAWALGRRDAKYLLILRRLILDLQPLALRPAIHLLAHAGLHPDIFWTPHNWIPQAVTEKVVPSFRWAPEEIVHMLRVIESEEWGRGTLGQSMDVLLYEDPNIVTKLHSAIELSLKNADGNQAARAALLALTHSRDQRQERWFIAQAFPTLMEDELFREVCATVEEYGSISMY